MVDINKHRYYLFKILKDLYESRETAGLLGFKGGTALMFFYELPRFSVDLDFNLLDSSKSEPVYEKIRAVITKYGELYDEAVKYNGILAVLSYGKGERKLKIEVSTRDFGDKYEIRNLMGVSVKVMVAPDMFAHKLCALLDRPKIISRDIFDCWFFLSRQTPVNEKIVTARMKMPLAEYIQLCIVSLEKVNENKLLSGLGDVLDDQMKNFVRTKLMSETLSYLKFYQKYPIFAVD